MLAQLAPVFLVFEVWQLIISERYVGLKQIARGADPRSLGLGEMKAFVWTLCLFLYWAWMFLLLTDPRARTYGLSLLVVSALGFAIRRGTPLRWLLVVLTLEGAVRIGLLLSLCGRIWWRR